MVLASVDSAYAQLEAQFEQDKTAADAALLAAQETAMKLGRLDDIAALIADLPPELAALFSSALTGYTDTERVKMLRDGRQSKDLSVNMRDIGQSTADITKTPISNIQQLSTKLYSDAEVLSAYNISKASYPGASREAIADVAYTYYGITSEQFNRVVDGSHRDGLYSVPYDGYVAELHRGERVLTNSEARSYNSTDSAEVAQLLDMLIKEVQELRREAQNNSASQTGAIVSGSVRIVEGVSNAYSQAQRRQALASRSAAT